jgi:multisubunit Na+/H+ antiporter MnhC subunit
MTPFAPPRKPYRPLTRTTVRALSVLSIGGLWSWFLLKFLLPSASGAVELMVGLVALVAAVAAIPLMLSTYAFRANAPDGQIDEREVLERNRAYHHTLLYLLTGVLLAFIAIDARRLASPFSLPVVSNLLQVLFLTSIVLPTALLAWWDRGEPDAD